MMKFDGGGRNTKLSTYYWINLIYKLIAYALQVVVCSCPEELHQRIETSQLTSELGGSLFYNHQEWIDTRLVWIKW